MPRALELQLRARVERLPGAIRRELGAQEGSPADIWGFKERDLVGVAQGGAMVVGRC